MTDELDNDKMIVMKDTRGKFVKGNTFGKGRPGGSRNKVTVLLQEMADGHAAEIMNTAVQKAIRGDVSVSRLLKSIFTQCSNSTLSLCAHYWYVLKQFVSYSSQIYST